MPNTLTETRTMGRPRTEKKTMPVRLTEDALKWAKIASGYTGESAADYISRVVVERGKEDADRLHEELKSGQRSKRSKGPD